MAKVSTDTHDYAIELGGYRYGFVQMDSTGGPSPGTSSFTYAELGPLGRQRVPVTATAGVALSLASLVLIAGLFALAVKHLVKRFAKS